MNLRSHLRNQSHDASLRRLARPQLMPAQRDGQGVTLRGELIRGASVSNEAIGSGDGVFLAADSGVSQQERRQVRRAGEGRGARISPVLDIIWFWNEDNKSIFYSERLGRKEFAPLDQVRVIRPDLATENEIDIYFVFFPDQNTYIVKKINLGTATESVVLTVENNAYSVGDESVVTVLLGGAIPIIASTLPLGFPQFTQAVTFALALPLGTVAAYQYPEEIPNCNSVVVDGNASLSGFGSPETVSLSYQTVSPATFYPKKVLAVSSQSYVTDYSPNTFTSLYEVKIIDQIFTFNNLGLPGELIFSELQDLNSIKFPPEGSSDRYIEISRLIANNTSLVVAQSKRIPFPAGVPDFASADIPKSALFNTGNRLNP